MDCASPLALCRSIRHRATKRQRAAALHTGPRNNRFFTAGENVGKLVFEATMFVSHEIIAVWTGAELGGNDPAGRCTRVSGLDPIATSTMEPV